MTATIDAAVETGDVLEVEVNGETLSTLVLLAAEDALILDACNGSTPFVVKRSELGEFRRFVPTV